MIFYTDNMSILQVQLQIHNLTLICVYSLQETSFLDSKYKIFKIDIAGCQKLRSPNTMGIFFFSISETKEPMTVPGSSTEALHNL